MAYKIRLLQQADDMAPRDTPSIALCGSRWVLNEYDQIPDGLNYTCVSYVWGQEKASNPLHIDQMMSARAVPAIEAAMKASRSPENWDSVPFSSDRQKQEVAKAEALSATNAFWVDAFCIPTETNARAECIQNMGSIYSSAWQVFVVLSLSSAIVFRQMRDTGHLDSEALFALESDSWVTRAWTYQEIANSRALYFIAQNEERVIISGHEFLNANLIAADNYKALHEIDSLTWRTQHAVLSRLADLIADYKVANYSERSAYQVMSAMHTRLSERLDDHFFAMIGAITNTATDVNDDVCSPSEHFMRACEAKGDYSYLYNVAPRSEIIGRRWRPIEGKFPPILPMPLVFGKGQLGTLHPTHISLESMCRMLPGAISAESLDAIKSHLAMIYNRPRSDWANFSVRDVACAVLEVLRTRDFSGCGKCIELENGLFFPQSKPDLSPGTFVAISLEIHWHGGRPGMLLLPSDAGIHDFYDLGVYVGRVPANAEEEEACVR